MTNAIVNTTITKSLRSRNADLLQIKKAIWLYIFLLIFEGALRKWVLPGMSNVLLIVRDPVAIYLLLMAIKKGWFNSNMYVIAMTIISVLSFLTALIFGHGNMEVAIFGLRITLLHFPLLFVIGKAFDISDVLKVGKVFLWIALPMILLNAMQFYTPQSSWFNRGVGGDVEGAGFSGAMGFYRPPGTFSFTNGNVFFWSVVGVFLIYLWLNRKQVNKWLLYSASIALFGAISFAISRTLVFQLALTVAFAFFALARKPRYLTNAIIALVAFAVVFVIFSQLDIFSTGIEAFEARFESATEVEGGGSVSKGVFDRMILGGMVSALTGGVELPFFGYGLGMGTNAGAKILTGNTTFLISEGEWGRLLGECGFLLGLGMIIIRVVLTISLMRKAYQAIQRANFLPWLLVSVAFINILQGQWAQPTSLGFAVLMGGLVIAANKQRAKKTKNLLQVKNIPKLNSTIN